jgi:hypothetical protein
MSNTLSGVGPKIGWQFKNTGESDIPWSLFNLRECSNEKIAFTSLMVLEARNGLTGYSG